MTRRIVIGQPVVDWANKVGNFTFSHAVGFGVEREGNLIAAVIFEDYNGANIAMHVVSDGSRFWMTKELLWMVFDYAFNQVKVKRITGLVAEDNVDAQLFDEHIGFKLETTLADAHPSGDLLVYVMRRADCRWLVLGKTPLRNAVTEVGQHENKIAA